MQPLTPVLETPDTSSVLVKPEEEMEDIEEIELSPIVVSFSWLFACADR